MSPHKAKKAKARAKKIKRMNNLMKRNGQRGWPGRGWQRYGGVSLPMNWANALR